MTVVKTVAMTDYDYDCAYNCDYDCNYECVTKTNMCLYAICCCYD